MGNWVISEWLRMMVWIWLVMPQHFMRRRGLLGCMVKYDMCCVVAIGCRVAVMKSVKWIDSEFALRPEVDGNRGGSNKDLRKR